MATRKPKQAPLSTAEKVKTVIKDERWSRTFGLLFYLFGIFLFISFFSFFFTWKQDNDKLIPFKWDHLFDSTLTVDNWFGKIGSLVSHLFFFNGFGLASIAVIFLLFRIGFRLINGKASAPIWPVFRNVAIFIIMASTLFELIFPNAAFPYSGLYGMQIILWAQQVFGNIGTWFVYIFLCLGLLVWFRSMNPAIFSFKNLFPEFSLKVFSFLNLEALWKKTETFLEAQEYTTPEDLLVENLANKNKTTEQDVKDKVYDSFDIDFGMPEINNTKKTTLVSSTSDLEFVIDNQNSTLPGGLLQHEIDFKIDDIDQNLQSEILLDTFTHPSQKTTIQEIEGEDEELLKIRAELDNEEDVYNPILELSKYVKPPLELLDDFNEHQIPYDRAELSEKKDQIVNTLLNYKIEITGIKATVGPTVTLYEIIPAPGVRISKIKNLEDDIALSLAALGIRIIAPIPGKGTIGIEVPNQKKQIVGQKDLLNSDKFKSSQMDLPIAFGKTISNEVFVADLAKMPHLLIAGATGQGKSVGINAILISILTYHHPAHVKLVLIDPKKVELNIYNKLEHHFLCMLPDQDDPIITDTKKVIRTLSSLVIEMETRYDLLKKASVRNIREYNQKFVDRKLNPQKGHKFLPFIVLIIDEFADLIMTAGKEIETPIARLAQLSRAVGIHLIIATQRPSVNIITGIIKANFPARIAYKVSSKVDSRTILDSGGADQLIGRGDMLLTSEGKVIRIQSGFVDTHEVEKVVDFISSQQGYPTPYLLPEVPDDTTENSKSGSFKLSDLDEMIHEAALLVVQNHHGSTSMIQRRLKLGYNRAGRIMDQLEGLGIVGPSEGSKPREVLIHSEMEIIELMNRIS